MVTIANLFIDQGSTFSTSVNVKNDDETPFDLTNHTGSAAQIKNRIRHLQQQILQ